MAEADDGFGFGESDLGWSALGEGGFGERDLGTSALGEGGFGEAARGEATLGEVGLGEGTRGEAGLGGGEAENGFDRSGVGGLKTRL